MSPADPSPNESERLRSSVQFLESRVAELERKFSVLENSPIKRYLGWNESDDGDASPESAVERKGLESTIGEDGFAWLSSIIILFSVVFLMILFQKKVSPLSASLIGLVSTGAVFLLTWLMRVKFPTQVYRIRMGAFLLFFYVVLRMHFFTDSPVIQGKGLALILLLVPVFSQFIFAWLRKSQFLTAIGLVMLVTAGMLSGLTFVVLAAGLLAALIAMILYIRLEWRHLLLFSLFLVYLNHLVWLFGNPLTGNPLVMVSSPQGNIVFLFLYGILYSIGSLFFRQKERSDNFCISVNLWNAALFSGILLLQVTKFYRDHYMLLFLVIAIFSMAYSILLKIKEKNAFIIAFYACVSFVSLSIMIFGFAGLPGSYLWLALQSLLVVSIALWFRLKLIVIVNAFLFTGLLIFYLIQTKPIDSIDIIFSLTALLTARILNWKKERLTLKSENLRNFYLLSAFFLVPFTLYHAVPGQFITLSWVGAAAAFFGLGLLIKNLKYRWMAVGTLILAICYLFLIDLKTMDIGFRVVALLIVAAITLSGSLFYTNQRRKKKSDG